MISNHSEKVGKAGLWRHNCHLVSGNRENQQQCARGGQYVDKIRPSDMSGTEKGFQKRKNGKRKCNLMEENAKISDYFSPGKLPKLTNSNFSSRLGGDPGMGGQW